MDAIFINGLCDSEWIGMETSGVVQGERGAPARHASPRRRAYFDILASNHVLHAAMER